MRQTWRWFGPKDLVLDRRHAAGRRRRRRHGAAPRAERRGLDPGGDRAGARPRSAGGATARPRASPGRWSKACRSPRTSRSRRATGASISPTIAQSLRNLAAAGIEVVCYNFMPVLDWTRTDLRYRVAHGGTCMRFDLNDFAAFDIHILKRRGAAEDYPGGGARRGGVAASPPWTRRAQQQLAAQRHLRPARLDREPDARRPARASRRVRRDPRRHAARALRRLPRGGGADRRGARPPPLLPPGRSAVPAARPAADHVDRGRLRRDHGRGRQPGQRHDAVLGLARRPAGQRPAGHDGAPRRPGALPAPAQRQAREAGRSAARSTRPSTWAATPTWWR